MARDQSEWTVPVCTVLVSSGESTPGMIEFTEQPELDPTYNTPVKGSPTAGL
jgi:hypothetical protein